MGREWSSLDENRLLREHFGVNPPWWLFNFGHFLLSTIQWLLNVLNPAALRVSDIALGGHTISHVVYALTDLGVAEALADGPLSIEELCHALGGVVCQDRLYRVLRTAINFGLFAEVRQKGQPLRYRNNRLSAVLREEHEQSQKYLILSLLGPLGYTPVMSSIGWGIRTGQDIFKHAFPSGGSHWDMLSRDQVEEDRFSRAMTDMDRVCLGVLTADIPWGKWSKAVDVGGAYGSMLATVLKAQPHMTGTLFDQPQVWQKRREEETFGGCMLMRWSC
eukprot:jgi/Botrbrau1/14449/Bobra.0014s0094.1